MRPDLDAAYAGEEPRGYGAKLREAEARVAALETEVKRLRALVEEATPEVEHWTGCPHRPSLWPAKTEQRCLRCEMETIGEKP